MDKPPVNVVGRWAGNASAVAIGPNYILTAAHPTLSGDTFVVFGGTSYHVAQIFQHPTADLRVARIENPAGGPANLTDFVLVYDVAVDGSEVGKTAVIGGFGRPRGADLIAGATPYGYTWGPQGNDALHWGANRVDGTQAAFNSGAPFNFVSDLLLDDFDAKGGATSVPFEAALAVFDSGGGWFVKVGSQWKVAGLNAYTEHSGESWFADNLNTGAVELPELNAAIRLSSYVAFIAQTVPEPSNVAMLAMGAVAGLGMIARRRRTR